ncbi:MAG: 3'-5' exonuclease [Caulobacteraceae bacterium]|nr:3'-5' exonuclease [Caulobacteraceae bacterium]
MANFQKLCIFDFETDGSNPEVCSPVQIAAVIVDPKKLEIIKDSEFNITLKPSILEEKPEYSYEDSDVLDFHAKVKGCDKSKILADWHTYQKQEHGWKMFVSYLEMYHTRSERKSCFSAPIAAGYNINRFDLPIVDKLSKKYKTVNKEGKNNLFYPRDVLDLMNVVFYWFEGNNELKNYTLDNLRDYFGIDKEGAHDALKDVRDTAEILIRFMKLYRNLSEKVKFKNSFKQNV